MRDAVLELGSFGVQRIEWKVMDCLIEGCRIYWEGFVGHSGARSL